MVNYKQEYLKMKLKYINAKYQKGGAGFIGYAGAYPGIIPTYVYRNLINPLDPEAPSNLARNISQMAINAISALLHGINITVFTINYTLRSLPNVPPRANEEEMTYYGYTIDKTLQQILDDPAQAAHHANIQNVLDTFRNQFQRADGSY